MAIAPRTVRLVTTVEELRRGHPGGTRRIDAWWTAPAATALGLVVCFGYLTLRAFNATHVWYAPYISPTVAPPLFTPVRGYPGAVPVDHAWLGAFPGWWPAFLPQSPAFFVPALAIAFRFTCYYYRGAYYKALFLTPPSCAVRGVVRRYRGETTLLLVQNIHRYTLYCALFMLVCLWWEGVSAFFLDGRPGIGVGSVIMVINAALLTAYAFGCHSWRHLIGGRYDCFSCGAARRGPQRARTARSIWQTGLAPVRYFPWYGAWRWSSWLNERHMLFAWCSLVWVVATDLYIYLLSTGVVRDLNTW
jgi:hypothetical protein